MTTTPRSSNQPDDGAPSQMGLLIFSWLFVGVPLVWGVLQTLLKALALFH
jgi:hypothetical protein